MNELVDPVALTVVVVLVQSAYTADLWKPHARRETPCAPRVTPIDGRPENNSMTPGPVRTAARIWSCRKYASMRTRISARCVRAHFCTQNHRCDGA